MKLATLPALILSLALGACGERHDHADRAGQAAPAPPAGAAVAAATPTPRSGVVRVLSYNVAGLLQGISQSQPITNIPLMSPKLNGYDLVLAQEDFFYHDLLAAGAAHPYRSQPMTGQGTLANDGLNRFSASPFAGFRRETWKVCHGYLNAANDCLSSKGFSFARHTLDSGVELDVYNLHADAGRASGDVAARSAQFQQLAAAIQTQSAGRPIIVAGDTNLVGNDPGDEPVLRAFFLATGLVDTARYLGGRPEQIDRIFFRSAPDLIVKPLSWRIAAEFVDAAGAPLSDHEAVHVDFRWTAPR